MPKRRAIAALEAVRGVLGNSAIRRLEIAWTAGMAADGAFLVVLLVVAYNAGGGLMSFAQSLLSQRPSSWQRACQSS